MRKVAWGAFVVGVIALIVFLAISTSGQRTVVLDVRTVEEFYAGHIEGAVLMPSFALAERAGRELRRGDEILIYCATGNRSAVAAEYLRALGFTNVRDLGGIEAATLYLESRHQ